MALVRWEPFGELRMVRREADRLWDRFFSPSFVFGENEFIAPPIDVSETENELVVKADLPGLSDKDIDVTVKDEMLVIKGEKKQEKEEKGEHYHHVERSFGSFSRKVALPKAIDYTKVNAKFENGVLTVTLPKAEDARPKKIEVN